MPITTDDLLRRALMTVMRACDVGEISLPAVTLETAESGAQLLGIQYDPTCEVYTFTLPHYVRAQMQVIDEDNPPDL